MVRNFLVKLLCSFGDSKPKGAVDRIPSYGLPSRRTWTVIQPTIATSSQGSQYYDGLV